ncbi:SpoIIIAH-like family protein [Hungatella hathewayi]|uniref:SpoIIIAH-like family protein n=1 Tax=Hungatella hathewayi TaxID=154046 RepID=UPI001DAB6CC1|nr:SpoIIIAH-like family protein [Hungatella hathewayi]MBS6754752.1 SpoIIIAH-like family protein [Hungatella hathewayi]
MRSLKDIRESKVPGTPKKMNMKKLFRRNQIIITTLAVMIAAAGYLNYAGKQEMASGTDVYEAGVTDISDEDILAENQALTGDPGNYQEIASLDNDPSDESLAAQDTDGSGSAAASNQEGVAGDAAADTANAADNSAAEGGQLAANDVASSDTETGLENPGEAVLTSGMNVSDYIANVQLSREQVRAKNKETLMNLINNENIEEAAKQEAIQEMIDMTAISEKENAAETLLMAKGFSDPVVSITSGKVDVVINASSITDPQRAQIEDIVKRKTEVGAENIVITLMKLEE